LNLVRSLSENLIEEANAIIDESEDLSLAIDMRSYDIVYCLLNSNGCDPNGPLFHLDKKGNQF
jgi:hypothetical protein